MAITLGHEFGLNYGSSILPGTCIQSMGAIAPMAVNGNEVGA